MVGTITGGKTVKIMQEAFPDDCFRTTEYSKGQYGSYQLVSLETLKRFLAKDQTNCGGAAGIYRRTQNPGVDEFAFRLKIHWIMAGIPPWSLGLIKAEREGREVWHNIFLTIENEEYVLYDGVPLTEEIVKLERPDRKVCRVMMGDTF